jgi:hypothetical protein
MPSPYENDAATKEYTPFGQGIADMKAAVSLYNMKIDYS